MNVELEKKFIDVMLHKLDQVKGLAMNVDNQKYEDSAIRQLHNLVSIYLNLKSGGELDSYAKSLLLQRDLNTEVIPQKK